METIAKTVFFIFVILLFAMFLEQTDFRFSLAGDDGTEFRDELTPRDTYIESYDTNDDGIISDTEYTRGELERIERTVEELRIEVAQVLEESYPSVYTGKVFLEEGAADESRPGREYIRIEAGNDIEERVIITGWKLKSLTSGETVTIPGRSGRPIRVDEDSEISIITGRAVSEDSDRNDIVRIYLKRRDELWNNEHEVILLIDQNKKVVDYVEY